MFTGRIKKIILSCVLMLLVLIIGFSIGVYSENKSVNFGSTNDPVPRKRLKDECCRDINKEGLSDLNAYGSGLIYYRDFKNHIINNLQKTGAKIYVINLLDDEIYYHKDRCLRWYGLGYFNKNLGDDLFSQKIIKTTYKKLIRLIYGTPAIYDKSQLQTERDIVQDLGGHYYLPLKGHGEWLNNDQFIEDTIHFFKSIPSNAHLYVHCAHGKGRTTSYLALYDIFRNAKKVPLNDITNRHYCLGREDVLNTKLWPGGTWTQDALDARRDLMVRFHNYMTDTNGYDHQTWTQWNNAQGIHNPQKIGVHRKEEKTTELAAIE